MERVGNLFILWSTHVGGERHKHQQMQDTRAISKKGHFGFAVSITCSTNCTKIERVLLSE